MNWAVLATIAAPVIALFVGVWINRRFESRPILISHFGHVSAFRAAPPDAPAFQVNTHSVVLRNTGRRSATNVRLHHTVLPDFNIWPVLVHHVEALPDESRDIVIPTLVPGEEITISYLYFPPLTFAQVNAGIKSDQGFAHPIPVLLQQQYPQWFNRLVGALMLAGLIATIYLLYSAATWIVRYL